MTAPICEYWSYDLVLCCSGFKEILLKFIGIGIKFSVVLIFEVLCGSSYFVIVHELCTCVLAL